MRILRALFWVLFALSVFLTLSLLVCTLQLAGTHDLEGILPALQLSLRPILPLTLTFREFLVMLAAVCVFIVPMLFLGAGAIIVLLVVRLHLTARQRSTQAVAGQHQIQEVAQEFSAGYQLLRGIGNEFLKQLDKEVLIQKILRTAVEITSAAGQRSIASFWIFNLESETLDFAGGISCDAGWFEQTQFQPTESFFARVLASQQPWMPADWSKEAPWIKHSPEELSKADTGLLAIPLVVQGSTLGVLILLCQQSVLEKYESQRALYEVVWAQMALAIAVVVQGEAAILDRLTGVHNRTYFMKRLTQELDRATRYHYPLALLMIDVDHFKQVNDSLGHQQGDALLKIIAKFLKKGLRSSDLAARYGGDEFIVMLPETGMKEDDLPNSGAMIVAERLRRAVDDEFQGLQKPLNVTVSVGIAVRRFPQDRETTLRDLIRLADEQLYRAKTTGKNRVCILAPEKPAVL
jgi:diguanylate cyclase (GGDEF)-like protein